MDQLSTCAHRAHGQLVGHERDAAPEHAEATGLDDAEPSDRRSSEVAASDREHRPGDVGGLVGGEKGDRRGLFIQGPVPLEQR